MALCGAFPSSGLLRVRLVLSLIILRHCVVPPDSFEYLLEESVKDGDLKSDQDISSWGQPMGLFDWDDWEESYNNFIELQSLLERNDVTVRHPITRIQLRRQDDASHSSGTMDIESVAPTWIVPLDMELSGDKNLTSGNELWTEALRTELQDILLSIRVMQALSIYVRQYIYPDEQDEVERIQMDKYL